MRLALALLLGIYPATAMAMPFLAIPIFVGTIFATTVGTALSIALTVAITVATTVIGQMEQKKAARKAKRRAAIQRENFLASLADRTITGVASESPHRYIYGQARVGSDVIALFTAGENDEFRYLVCIHAAHECEEIGEIWIDGEPLGPLDANGDVTEGKFFKTWTTEAFEDVPGEFIEIRGELYQKTILVTTVHETSQVTVKKHLGEPGQLADQMLIDELEPGDWKDTSTLDGFCYTVVKLNLEQAVFQNGLTRIEPLIKGRTLYDPREASTAWSENQALCKIN